MAVGPSVKVGPAIMGQGGVLLEKLDGCVEQECSSILTGMAESPGREAGPVAAPRSRRRSVALRITAGYVRGADVSHKWLSADIRGLVLDSFREMTSSDRIATGQVRNRPRDLEDVMEDTSGEPEPFYRPITESAAGSVETTVDAHGEGIQGGVEPTATLVLDSPGSGHPAGHRLGTLSGTGS